MQEVHEHIHGTAIADTHKHASTYHYANDEVGKHTHAHAYTHIQTYAHVDADMSCHAKGHEMQIHGQANADTQAAHDQRYGDVAEVRRDVDGDDGDDDDDGRYDDLTDGWMGNARGGSAGDLHDGRVSGIGCFPCRTKGIDLAYTCTKQDSFKTTPQGIVLNVMLQYSTTTPIAFSCNPTHTMLGRHGPHPSQHQTQNPRQHGIMDTHALRPPSAVLMDAGSNRTHSAQAIPKSDNGTQLNPNALCTSRTSSQTRTNPYTAHKRIPNPSSKHPTLTDWNKTNMYATLNPPSSNTHHSQMHSHSITAEAYTLGADSSNNNRDSARADGTRSRRWPPRGGDPPIPYAHGTIHTSTLYTRTQQLHQQHQQAQHHQRHHQQHRNGRWMDGTGGGMVEVAESVVMCEEGSPGGPAGRAKRAGGGTAGKDGRDGRDRRWLKISCAALRIKKGMNNLAQKSPSGGLRPILCKWKARDNSPEKASGLRTKLCILKARDNSPEKVSGFRTILCTLKGMDKFVPGSHSGWNDNMHIEGKKAWRSVGSEPPTSTHQLDPRADGQMLGALGRGRRHPFSAGDPRSGSTVWMLESQPNRALHPKAPAREWQGHQHLLYSDRAERIIGGRTLREVRPDDYRSYRRPQFFQRYQSKPNDATPKNPEISNPKGSIVNEWFFAVAGRKDDYIEDFLMGAALTGDRFCRYWSGHSGNQDDDTDNSINGIFFGDSSWHPYSTKNPRERCHRPRLGTKTELWPRHPLAAALLDDTHRHHPTSISPLEGMRFWYTQTQVTHTLLALPERRHYRQFFAGTFSTGYNGLPTTHVPPHHWLAPSKRGHYRRFVLTFFTPSYMDRNASR